MILVIPPARYSQVSVMLSRSGPLGMAADRVMVALPLGGILLGLAARSALRSGRVDRR